MIIKVIRKLLQILGFNTGVVSIDDKTIGLIICRKNDDLKIVCTQINGPDHSPSPPEAYIGEKM